MGEPYYHTAILQRLNIHHVNGGKKVFYSLPAFEHTEDWENIPVIMPSADPTDGHPDDFDAIFRGEIPDGYQQVGYITGATIPEDGAARLEADVVLESAVAEELAKAGSLALSTGFLSDTQQIGEDEWEIIGRVRPNHVLAFEQGICPNCYPNDQGCMMMNRMEQNKMTEEAKAEADFSETQKGFLASFVDKIKNACAGVPREEEEKKANEELPESKETEYATVDIDELKAEVERLRKALEERDAVIAEMKAADEQKEKDAAWNQLANHLPPAWKENEAETRAEFEANPAQFVNKLMEHQQKFANVAVKAEGKQDCGCPLSEEQKLKNKTESNAKKIGFTPME